MTFGKLMKRFALLSTFLTSFATHAYSQDAVKTPVGFNFFISDYNTGKEKTDITSNSTEKASDSLNTMPLQKAFVSMSHNNFSLYLYPFDQGFRLVSLGWMATDKIELGLDLAKIDRRNKTYNLTSRSSTMVVWVAYYDSIGDIGIETVVTYDAGFDKSRTVDSSGVATETSLRSTFFKPNVLFVFPITSNFFYFAGIGYTVYKTKNTDSVSASGNYSSTSKDLNLTLAGVRIKLAGK